MFDMLSFDVCEKQCRRALLENSIASTMDTYMPFGWIDNIIEEFIVIPRRSGLTTKFDRKMFSIFGTIFVPGGLLPVINGLKVKVFV